MLLIDAGRLKLELGQRCRNIHERSNQRYHTAHLCPVLGRIIRPPQSAPQCRCSEHAQPDDLFFGSLIHRAPFRIANQHAVNCGQTIGDGHNDIVSGPHTSESQFHPGGNNDRYERHQ